MAVIKLGTSDLDGHPLPCGRLVEDVFDDLDTGSGDDHSRTCAHCATARRSLVALMDATRALVDDPTGPPAGLIDRIMAAVRVEVRRGDTLPLTPTDAMDDPITPDLGPVDISEQAVAAVLRYAADTVDGVWSRSCRIAADPDAPNSVLITLTVSLRYGSGPVEHQLSAVRERVASGLEGQVGMNAGSIDIQVVDLWPEGQQ